MPRDFESVENPTLTGKTQGNENFPVGSLLLPRAIRPHVAAFYRFARAADDVADDPGLDRDTKLAQLDAMDAALQGLAAPDDARTATGRALRAVLLPDGFTVVQPRALLVAFRRDAVNEDTPDWAGLIDYCRWSAMPVGRFLIEVHRETDPEAATASDALCAALQVLNHLQDTRKDFTAIDRVYAPADWLAEAGLDRSALGGRESSAALMRVFDRMLDGVEDLLTVARPLHRRLRCAGFRMESAMIVSLAHRLARRLRGRDPLAVFRGLQPIDWALAGAAGVIRGITRS